MLGGWEERVANPETELHGYANLLWNITMLFQSNENNNPK